VNVHRCSTCQQPLPSSHPLVAGKVNRPATVNRRSPDAATNELATEIRAASDGDIVGPFDIADAVDFVKKSMMVPSDMLTAGNAHATATEHAIRTRLVNAEDVIDPHAAPLVVTGQGEYRRAFYGANGVPRGQAGGGL